MAYGDKYFISGPAMFWLFMVILTLTLAWVYVRHPPSVLSQVLDGTEQERMMRNLQDPLAMRLWVISDMSFGGNAEHRMRAVDSVIKQWSDEVKDLKEKAYHTKAADMSWNLKGLDLTDEQKKAVAEINKTAEVNISTGTGTIKPAW